jgi:hypothetical protein
MKMSNGIEPLTLTGESVETIVNVKLLKAASKQGFLRNTFKVTLFFSYPKRFAGHIHSDMILTSRSAV